MLAERFLSRTAGVVLAMLLMAGAGLAQKPGGGGGGAGAGAGGGGGSTTGPGGGRTTPTLPNPTIPNNNTQQRPSQFPDMNRPIFLSGKVQMDDGTPPPESVVVERVCQGYVRPEAHTDSKGHFSF